MKISQRNFEEVLTQIFERFMAVGIDQTVVLSPQLARLVMDPELAGNHHETLAQAFEMLCHDLRGCLKSLGLEVIISMDHGEFNYAFSSMRGDSIVIQHLSNQSD